MVRQYRLYVPAAGRGTTIRDRSAIVGEPQGDRISVHYQGVIENSDVQTFEDCIQHAAGRREQNYPTVARAWLAPEDLIEVGTVHYDETLRRWVIGDLIDEDALREWAPGPHVPGGSPELRSRAAGCRWRDLSPQQQMRLHARSLHGHDMAEGVISELAAARTQAQPGGR